MAEVVVKPSSATEGFFQELPTVPPQYTSRGSQKNHSHRSCCDDPVLRRILSLYLPHPVPAQVDEHLHRLARECLTREVMNWTVDAEANAPTLHPSTTFGNINEVDALRTGEGWRRLKDFGITNGTVALGYATTDAEPTTWNKRVHQMAMNHVWAGSAALVTCPAAMSDGAAVLLGKHMNDKDGDQPGRSQVLNEARRRLVSFDPSYAWTSGQWMTERSGGSDVRETETRAHRLSKPALEEDIRQFGSDRDSIDCQLGPWRIDGFKWFSSATDADMVVMLAKTQRGLSAFFAPMRRRKHSSVVMNGVRITRLKNKLGTKALPTSELELKGMRGWLVGEEGQGVKEIAAILNATRIWTACGATAGLARGLAIARAYARVRKVRGRLLQDNLQHLTWMAEETVRYRASIHLAFLGVGLLGIIEQGPDVVRDTFAANYLPSDSATAEILLRFLVPVMKAQCSLAAVRGLRECMESLGGVGYCENNDDGGILNVARIFRDTNVNPIWEGTTSVMAEDVIRVLKGKSGHQALRSVEALVDRLVVISRLRYNKECSVILAAWTKLKQDMEDADASQFHRMGRALLGGLEDVLCSLLLMADAVIDGEPISAAVVTRWMTLKYAQQHRGPRSDWQNEAVMDKGIFLGDLDTTPTLKASL